MTELRDQLAIAIVQGWLPTRKPFLTQEERAGFSADVWRLADALAEEAEKTVEARNSPAWSPRQVAAYVWLRGFTEVRGGNPAAQAHAEVILHMLDRD